jgi:hypothetical protein
MRLLRDKSFPPQCPFCGQEIDRPKEVEGLEYYEFDGGRCSCGAVFGFDPTARNGGAVMMEAMVHACGDDYERASNLNPDQDYDGALVKKYNGITHRVGEPGSFGTLYFIRLNS